MNSLAKNKMGALLFNPVDIIAGVLLIVAGTATITGNINLGGVLAGLGLLIEALKVLFQQGW